MKVTFLGTGTSQGIPVIGCSCEVCNSSDARDNRLRTSAMVEWNGQRIVIDSGPDFRMQMLREKVQDLDAVLFTHEHKDHIAGLDDIRPFNYKMKKPMQVFASTAVQAALKREFHYAFDENKYPGVPEIQLNTIQSEALFYINKLEIIPIEVMHYKMPVLGFRMQDFVYITDAKTISDNEKEKMMGAKVLVLNALRKEEHISHFNLNEALELVKELKPEMAYFTHLSHLMGRHSEVSKQLPSNVSIAYDGLSIEI